MKMGSEFICPSDKEDKVTGKVDRELSCLTKNKHANNTKRSNFFKLVLSIIKLRKF